MPENGKLTDRQVRTNKAGFHGDGGGLWLRVSTTGTRAWIFRYKIERVAHAMGLGPYPDVTLAEAREQARAARKLARQRIDPIRHRRRERAAAKASIGRSFREVAEEYITAHRSKWSNPKHAAQWQSTLEAYAFPTIGNRAVHEIGLQDVLSILRSIWATKTETASRVRGRIEKILSYATVHGWRAGENPARWTGYLDQVLPAKGAIAPVEHHPALPWRDAPSFWRGVENLDGMAAICLRFIILTAVRSNEAREAIWDEIDFVQNLWVIPAERMKTRVEHRVPLSQQAVEILQHVQPLASSPIATIFPGMKRGQPLSDAAVSKVLPRAGRDDITVHGFRSTFRDWVAEATNFPRELAEAALAHALESKVEAAYQRGDLLERRRAIMKAWAFYVTKGPVNIPLRKASFSSGATMARSP